MQAMLYSLIEAKNDSEHNPNHRAVSPALLFIQHAGSEDYTPVLSIDKEEVTDVTVYEEDFLRNLTEKLEEIHNPNIALLQQTILIVVNTVLINRCVDDNYSYKR